MKAGFLEQTVVSFVVRARWKRNQSLVNERIRSFEATEEDSAWQLLHTAAQIENGTVKARLFMQALEETHHAEIFRALSTESGCGSVEKIQVERKPLYRGQEVWKLFAYFAVGEKAAAVRFRSIADRLEEGRLKRSLVKILEEEEGHVEMAESLTAITGQSEARVKREIKMVKLQRAGEAWLRLGRRMTSVACHFALSIAYYTVGGWIVAKDKTGRQK